MDPAQNHNINKDNQHVAELMRSGSYFNEARHWYQSLYIGPISERSLFLIIAVLGILVGLIGVGALVSLLPITERPALLVTNERLDEVVLDLTPMRRQGETLNAAVRRFFIKRYVLLRESYDAVTYSKNYAFVHAHSDVPTFAAYAQNFDPANVQSPLVTLGEFGARWVTVHSIDVNDSVEPAVATVEFSTETYVNNVSTITQWTATIGFYYSDLAVTPVVDPVTGEMRTQTQEPVFQVVSYVLTPATAAP